MDKSQVTADLPDPVEHRDLSDGPPGAESPTTYRWGMQPVVLVAMAVLAVGCLVWAFRTSNPEDRVVSGTAAVLLGIASIAGIPLLQRLRADDSGFTVRGPAGAHFHRWSDVVSLSAPSRRRRGLLSTSVEIDLADDRLIVLGRIELGTDPAEVAAVLRRLMVSAQR